MTVPERFSGLARLAAVTAIGLTLGAGLTACSGEEPQADVAADRSPAPVLGENDDRIQLTEGIPYTLRTSGSETIALEITGHSDGPESNVDITVAPEGGESAEHTLGHGDELELGGETWRVSELGFSDSMPGSTTLTRKN
ncbi:DUF6406 domain-containing protein [Nocardiopsis ansamitocini]|uniref:Lipoprotein n=1 Tax=Nocardiopsis ansamitocini TaxID=1670832 RepID=A0A9W6UIR8_9ACTN|nr:DUF6406 domain-containing protein [Nocardiopsis ansamitocini]GLU48019.1 hypothetical protein Nans01_23700 [Nocardiopsis ansamitocini]